MRRPPPSELLFRPKAKKPKGEQQSKGEKNATAEKKGEKPQGGMAEEKLKGEGAKGPYM